MLRSGVASEVRWLVFYVGALTFIGASLGFGVYAALFSLVSYLCWHFWALRQLEKWLFRARRSHKPSKTLDDIRLSGLGAEIAEDVMLIMQRHDKEKQRLSALVERVQDMTSALHDGVVLVDKRDNMEWWNHAANRLLGLQQVDVGHPLTNIVRDPQFQAYYEAGDYEEPLALEPSRQENRQLQFQVHPYGKNEHLVMIRDITRVAKLERMRRDFVANVSHELRTPLTVIRGYVETLQDLPELKPVISRALHQMQQQGQRMTTLINDLITLTKLETDDLDTDISEIQLRTLVDIILNDGKAISNDEVRLVNKVDENIVLTGNEKELRSAISNLVVNAIKYSRHGDGSARSDNTQCTVEVSSELDDSGFHLHVKDNGNGIDPKHLPRLTERFYRVDVGRSTAAGGTGLGLAIVKHVLLRHEAQLKIDSLPAKGSTFSCCFPLSRVRVGGD